MNWKLSAIALVILSMMLVATSFAEYQVGGQLDLVFRNNSANDWSNKTFKGFSNFDFIRARIFFDAQPSEKASVFTQVLVNNGDFQLFGAYARLSKLGGGVVNLQAGIIPTPVGIWGPRSYSDKNPLIGMPLMYLYHTALSPSPYQTTGAHLYAGRGEGYEHYGLPIIYDPCWNTGVEVFGSAGMIDWSIGALSGAVSAPRIQPVKDLPQFTGRLGVYFSQAFSLSFSGFAGPYLDDLSAFEPQAEEYPKLAAADAAYEEKTTNDYLNLGGIVGAHYDYGMLEAYAEAVFTRWEHPIFENLDAYSAYVDARYKLAAQWFVAGRAETMSFSKLDFGPGIGEQNWDYPLNRFELGLGWRVDESVILKLVTQITRSDQGEALNDEMVAFQLSTTIR